jgi:CysZ protein
MVKMDFLHQIRTSLIFYWRTYRFIESHALWRILILPAIINLFISIVIIIVAIRTSGYIVHLFMENMQFNSPDRSMLKFIEGLLMVIIRAMVFFLYLKIYRYLIIILLAPIFASISSKVQIIATGHSRKACTRTYLMDCSRGIQIGIRNFFIEAVLSAVIIVVSFIISWIIPLAPLLILIIESYFVGYSFTDYRNEHFGLSKKESRKLMNNYPGLVIGSGLFFNIFLLIPIIGVLLAPAFALIASGLAIDHLEKRKQLLCSSDQSTLMMADS